MVKKRSSAVSEGELNRQWAAEFNVSADLARSLLETQFPQLAPARVEFLAEGWDNTVFCVNRTLVFRFPRRKAAVDCMEAEIRVLPHLQTLLSFRIPRLLFIGKPSQLYPYPFAGYTMLPGTSAYRMALSDHQRIRSAIPFATFLKELHSIPVDHAVRMGAEPDRIGRMDLEHRIERFEQYLREAVQKGLLTDTDVWMDILRSLPSAGAVQRREALVHGDLNFRNFLVNEDGMLSGVIDWGDVHIGHPAVDIAIAHSFLPAAGKRMFREAYGDIDEDTWLLAKFRALYTNLYLLIYAHDIGDEQQFQEARASLERVLADEI